MELFECGPVQEIYNWWINQYARPSVGLLARLKRDLEGGV